MSQSPDNIFFQCTGFCKGVTIRKYHVATKTCSNGKIIQSLLLGVASENSDSLKVIHDITKILRSQLWYNAHRLENDPCKIYTCRHAQMHACTQAHIHAYMLYVHAMCVHLIQTSSTQVIILIHPSQSLTHLHKHVFALLLQTLSSIHHSACMTILY